jgi:hypothetical protein
MTPTPTKARICVALPSYGKTEVAREIAGTLFALGKQLDAMTVDGPLEALDPNYFSGHLVHARSELVHQFLRHPRDYTHLLFWDTDIVVKPSVFAPLMTKLLKCDRDIVSVPYAQKWLHWEEVKEDDPKGSAVWYVPDFRMLRRGPIEADDCAEMIRVPIGFALIKRGVLERMTECYASSLSYFAAQSMKNPNELTKIVALFMVEITDRYPELGGPAQRGIPVLLGEDYAFIDRWTRIGGKCHVYLGPEAPLGHQGTLVYQGSNAQVRRDFFAERDAAAAVGGTTSPAGLLPP